MGTPEFAVPCLDALVKNGEKVSAVFTQPDKPKGRGMKLLPTPVKEAALGYGIPVYQPQSLKKGEDAERSLKILKEISPDLIVVVAYGKLLPVSILELPKYFCINVHASLLPRYRGAAPIQRVILNGEKKTGVTTMLMAEGLDTGDMLLSAETQIGENETAAELTKRLSKMGADLLIDTVKNIDSITPVPQDDSKSNYAAMITKDLCPIDFSMSAREIHNRIRGLSDSPCAKAVYRGKILKIYASEMTGEKTSAPPGTIVNEKKFTVACGDGNTVTFTQIQAEGGKRMKTADYLRGKPAERGEILS